MSSVSPITLFWINPFPKPLIGIVTGLARRKIEVIRQLFPVCFSEICHAAKAIHAS